MTFESLPGQYSVCRLAAQAEVPSWVVGEGFSSVTRTDRELSIVVPQNRVPPGIQAERGWSGFCIAGTLDFSEIGVLSSVADVLAKVSIPIFVVSTFDTDFVFVPSPSMKAAIRALVAAGHSFDFQ